MNMGGEHEIPLSRARVWAALNDVDVLRRSIPGCQSLEHLSDRELVAKVMLKVGPLKATFHGRVILSDLLPPERYTITGEGQGGAVGFAKGSAVVVLEELSPSTTRLRYEAQSQIGGKIAQLGSRLIDATARRLAADFFEAFARAAAEEGVLSD
jgi:uncharacterized protein